MKTFTLLFALAVSAAMTSCKKEVSQLAPSAEKMEAPTAAVQKGSETEVTPQVTTLRRKIR